MHNLKVGISVCMTVLCIRISVSDKKIFNKKRGNIKYNNIQYYTIIYRIICNNIQYLTNKSVLCTLYALDCEMQAGIPGFMGLTWS